MRDRIQCYYKKYDDIFTLLTKNTMPYMTTSKGLHSGRRREDVLLVRCPVCALPTVRLRCTPTAATRSGRVIRHRRRSHRSPLPGR